MAKIIYACSRKTPFGENDESRIYAICARLSPDNLSRPASHKIVVNGTLAYGIANYQGASVRGDSVLLGCLYGEGARWESPGEERPDGSYALFRSSADFLEAASDAAASRTIWYYFDDAHFIASTSQRAIIMFLGGLQFDERIISWMLPTGTLGPHLSWDKRIKRLPPDASVALDRRRWSLSVDSKPVAFTPLGKTHAEHRESLQREIREVVRSLGRSGAIDFKSYVLPLSGGYDSRGILCLLRDPELPPDLRTVTWGLEASLDRRGNDAAVARELAGKVGARHRYFHTDIGNEPAGAIIDRFIACGEGRVDHLSGYMDGLETWRKLLEEEGCRGIIRGDEGFGWIPVSSELTVRLAVGMALCADYRNLADVIERFGLPEQEFPVDLQRKKEETLEAWRDRLYHAYRMPTILAALSDIKYSYVEIVNPLLARSILYRVRTVPDSLRTNKALFKEIINAISPEVPYANEGANASPSTILRNKEIVELMREKLSSDEARRIFGGDFLDYVLGQMRDEGSSASKKPDRYWGSIKRLVPRFIKNRIRDVAAKPSLNGNVLAFRVFLVVRMHEILNADCEEVTRTATLDSNASAGPCRLPPVNSFQSIA